MPALGWVPASGPTENRRSDGSLQRALGRYSDRMWPFRNRAAATPGDVDHIDVYIDDRLVSTEPWVDDGTPPHDRRTGEVIDDEYFVRLRQSQAHAAHAAHVRGRSLWAWMPVIEQFKREGRLDDARDLVMECIDAMEQWAAILGHASGAAGWYRRAAIIFRKLGDYDGEVAVIDRGLSFMPTNQGLLARRESAVRLRG